MFIRRATIEISDILTQNDVTKKWSWVDVVKKSTLLKKSDFLPAEAFEYDPDNFVYFRARSITADVPNGNGDYFEQLELESSYKTFVGKGFYIEHDSDSIEKAKGIILDSVWHKEGRYIECLVAVDRKAYADIARQIEAGILNSVSMGCVVEEAECSLCHNIAHNQHELCEHMNPMSQAYCKGRLMPDGKKAYETNRKVTFSELSGVAQPADIEAHVFEVFAAIQNNLLKHAANYQNKKALSEGCPDGKCTLDVALGRLSTEERYALRSAMERTALNIQSPSTFQGNPAMNDGANPKKIMNEAPSTTTHGGGGNVVIKMIDEEEEKKKKRANVLINPDGVGTPDLLAEIQEATKPVPDKIDEQIKEAIKSRIDGIVSAEVMRQVDALLSDLLAQAQLPIMTEVKKQVEEHRSDMDAEVKKVQDEIVHPPETACAPDEFYGPKVMASVLIEKAIRRTGMSNHFKEAFLKQLYSSMEETSFMEALSASDHIEIGPELTLQREAGNNLLRLYRSGTATNVWLSPLNSEIPEMQKIALWREALGVDRKTDTAETPK